MYPRSRSSKLICFGFVALIGLSATARAETDAETLSAIRKVWSERRDSIKSFSFVCALEQTRKVVHGPTDVFGRPKNPSSPVLDEVFRKTMVYSRDQEKLALRLEGEEWSAMTHARGPYLLCASFSGTGNVTLLKDTPHPTSFIDHRTVPCDEVAVMTHEVACHLWRDPEQILPRFAWDKNKSPVIRKLRGDDTIAIEFTRGRAGALGRLVVATSKAFLPVGLQLEWEGAVESELNIEYAEDKQVPWIPKSWEQTLYKKPGELTDRVLGAVLKSSVNEALKSDLFEVSIPAGTYITEDLGEKKQYFLKQPDGSLKPITLEQFGKRDPGT